MSTKIREAMKPFVGSRVMVGVDAGGVRFSSEGTIRIETRGTEKNPKVVFCLSKNTDSIDIFEENIERFVVVDSVINLYMTKNNVCVISKGDKDE